MYFLRGEVRNVFTMLLDASQASSCVCPLFHLFQAVACSAFSAFSGWQCEEERGYLQKTRRALHETPVSVLTDFVMSLRHTKMSTKGWPVEDRLFSEGALRTSFTQKKMTCVWVSFTCLVSVSCSRFWNTFEPFWMQIVLLATSNLQVLQLAKAMEAQDYVTASKVQQECFPQCRFLVTKEALHGFSPTDLRGGGSRNP